MDNDFDVIQWRKEHPVDYIKSLELILSTPIPEVVDHMFKEIYKVMRLYIPDKLYKYYALNDDEELNKIKLKTLSDGKIFMSDPKDFNDPFDEKAFYYDSKKIANIERLKHCNGKLIDDFSKFWKVTSLTGNDYNDMPMWAHYSNNHKGYCVCYDTKEEKNLDIRSNTFQVQYTSERVDITSFIYDYAEMISNKIDESIKNDTKIIEIQDLSLIYVVTLLSNLKHTSWSYENEFRCSIGKGGNNDSYCNAIPKEIYVGMKCSIEYEKELIKIAKKYEIPIYKMNYVGESTGFILKPKKLNYE